MYIVAEVLEAAGDIAQEYKKKIIEPRSIMQAIRSDCELSNLCKDVVFPSAGVVSHIHDKLLGNSVHAKAYETNDSSATF